MATPAALSIEAVDKFYLRRGKPPVHAVKALDMAVGKGEIVALLGSSGCGKTSTLRMIAGFEDVSKGAISLAGRRIDPLKPAARNVAMAFEGYSLYPPLTVRENIAFALKAARLPRGEVDARVAAVAKLLEIEPILERYPSSISGGQQQRASLARALVRDADLYLLDEPMGQLEPQLRAVLRARLKSLLIEKGMTAIFVTHDQTEANALADRIAVMEGGVLQQFASQADLKERPANLFVATFIGEPPMNVVEARVSRAGGTTRFTLPNGPSLDYGEAEIAPAVRDAVGRRDRLVVGIRPHRLTLGQGPLKGRVLSNQWLGDQTHVAAEVAGKMLVGVADGRVRAKPGEEIAVGLPAADLHLFDPADGRALAHGGRAAGAAAA
jgi:multiple sugar transport system ATP-binding protein